MKLLEIFLLLVVFLCDTIAYIDLPTYIVPESMVVRENYMGSLQARWGSSLRKQQIKAKGQ